MEKSQRCLSEAAEAQQEAGQDGPPPASRAKRKRLVSCASTKATQGRRLDPPPPQARGVYFSPSQLATLPELPALHLRVSRHLLIKQSRLYLFHLFLPCPVYTAAAFSVQPRGDTLISPGAPNKLPPRSCQSVRTDVWNSDSQEQLARKNTITASCNADGRQINRLEEQSTQIVRLVLLPRPPTLGGKTTPPCV